MTMDETTDRVVRFLVDNARCSECDGRYHVEDVHVLAHDSDRVWDLAAVCHDCYQMSLIRAIVRSQDGHVHTLPSHELTAAEERRLRALPPIDQDDVLDVSAFLTDFEGDFRGLFSLESDER